MADQKNARYNNASGIAALCAVLAGLSMVGCILFIVLSVTRQDLQLLFMAICAVPVALGFLVSGELLKMFVDVAENSHRQAEAAEETTRLLRRSAYERGAKPAAPEIDPADDAAAMDVLQGDGPQVVRVKQIKRQ